MKHLVRVGVILGAFALTGCATTTNNPRDPLEGFNRTMFTFNDKVDQVALKPAAKVYRAVLPQFVQTGVGNFFGNLGDVWTGVNNILQGKVGDGVSDFMRFAVNSTLGLAGLLDISSEAGLQKHKEDFGQTLGKWGVQSGPYLVLPLLGSSTIRDTAALPLDFKGDLWSYTDPVRLRNSGTAVRLLDARASVLDASDLVEAAALDRYEFVRDAFLQRRESKINDGEAPRRRGDSTAPGQNSDSSKPGSDNAEPRAGPTPEPAVAPVPRKDAMPAPMPKPEATPKAEPMPMPKSERMPKSEPMPMPKTDAGPAAVVPPAVAAAPVEPVATVALEEPAAPAVVNSEAQFASSAPARP
jgi:phospholipid-binding lipoprotein MlaA